MITQDFRIPNIDWNVRVYYSITGYDICNILKSLREIGCSGDALNDAYKMLYYNELNTGYTFSNTNDRKSIIIIAHTSTTKEFANSLAHEQNHLKQHIAETIGIDPYSEEDCYLLGDIAEMMHDVSQKLLCKCCKKKIYKRLY